MYRLMQHSYMGTPMLDPIISRDTFGTIAEAAIEINRIASYYDIDISADYSIIPA